MFKFLEFVKEPLQINVVDIGAASMGPGTDAYAALLAYPNTIVYGFEPDAAACAGRNAAASPNQRFLPYFICDGSERTFYECVNPLTSSLYEPDAALLARFQRLDLPVRSQRRVQTTRLDDAGVDGVDYLKLDIQGAEIDAINGGPNTIAQALVIHTEVEFIPMYKGQGLFGDIDVALRRDGFMFHNFVGLFSRQYKPFIHNNDVFSAGSQLLYAEAAVYVRDLACLDGLERERLLKLATIMHDVYSAFDLVAYVLGVLDSRFGGAIVERYVRSLSAGRPLDAVAGGAAGATGNSHR
jgi:FkbM family methyltransferase